MVFTSLVGARTATVIGKDQGGKQASPQKMLWLVLVVHFIDCGPEPIGLTYPPKLTALPPCADFGGPCS